MEQKRVVKYVAISLALCFGWVGLHRHFLKTDYAAVMTFLGLVGLLFGIPLLVTWVWSIVDVVRMFNAEDVEVLFPVKDS